MEEGKLFEEIVKLLSEDEDVVREIKRFLEALEVPWTIVKPLIERYELGHKHPDVPLRRILSEWIGRQRDSATVVELRRILKECELVATADGLENLEEMNPGPIKLPNQHKDDSFAHSSRYPPPKKSRLEPITFGVRKVVLNFIGRQEELEKLQEYFHSGDCHGLCISGLGGIGKTELAKKFALSISSPGGNDQIATSWLSGETPQTLLNSCGKFGHHLGLSATDGEGKPLRMEIMLENITTKLNSSRWLVIIDNVDEIHEEFQEAVKILCGSGSDVFILVTSRRRDIFPGELELLEVSELKLENSIQFVNKSLKIQDNPSDTPVKSLCLQLGNFPLALGQAVAFIKQQQSTSLKGKAYDIQNYLDELTKTQTLGLDKDRKLSEYTTATLKVWNITLDKILDDPNAPEGKLALDLLDLIAFINPEDIKINSLVKLFNRFYTQYAKHAEGSDENETVSRDQIECCLNLLLKYSLISSFDEVMSIHRLVQLALRDRMTSSPSNKKYVDLLNNFWNSFDKDEWDGTEVTNILTIWNHSKIHPALDAHREDKIQSVYHKLQDLGMVNELYDFAFEGCKFLRDLHGSEHQLYLLMEQHLANAMMEKGQYEESLEKLTFVYEQFKILRGEDAPETFLTVYYIALVLHDLDRFEDSLGWAQKALQSSIRIYGENHETTMKAKNQLALALQNLGRRTEAIEMHNEIWVWEEVNLGTDHPSTLITRHNIASCLSKEEKFAEALKIFQEVLTIKENLSGAEHPDTLITKESVAKTLLEMGEWHRALELCEEVLTAREKVLGPRHPHTIDARENVTFLRSKEKV